MLHFFVLRNLTITVSEEVALWARRKAAEKNTSISKLVGEMLESQMRLTDEYRRAYQAWREISDLPGIDADARSSRDKIHERR